MKFFLHLSRCLRVRLVVAALTLMLAVFCVGHATAQAVPAAGGVPMGDANPEDQPLIGQQLGTDLTLNQGVGATEAENESFNRFGLGLQAEAGGITNFFGTQTDQATAAYTTLTADAGVNLRTSRTRYYLLYQPQYNIYPQYSGLNNYAQTLFQSLDHAITQHVGIGWDLTGARYLSLDQFLPQSLGIGGIGVVVPTLQSQVLSNSVEFTNAATNLRLRYLISARMTFTGTLTGGYFLLVPSDRTATTTTLTERTLLSGGDFRLDYQLNSHDSIGVELTPLYIYGLTPEGHLTAETLQATYKRQLTATTSISAAAGPLFFQTSIPGFGSTHDVSYSLNAGLNRQIRHSQLSISYARAFIVSFLSPPVVANEGSLNARVPLLHRVVLTAAASYTHETSSSSFGTVSDQFGGTLYGGTAQIAYLIGARTQLYGAYSRISDDLSYGQLQSYTFSQNKFGAGIRFNLGNAVTSGGAQ